MRCAYCGNEAKLVKAHIIPESFFRRLREGPRAPLLIGHNTHVKRAPIGIYDSEILCAECERIFQPWDDYAQAVLSQERASSEEIKHNNHVIGWAIPTYRYDLLKLFFASLLWRASVSKHPFYQRIKLGALEARVKDMIGKADPGGFDEFGVFLARFSDLLGQAMLDPHPERWDGIKYYRFYLGQYVAHIKTDVRPTPSTWIPFTMKPSQPLCIIARDMSRSKELAVMRRIVASTPKKKLT